MRSLIIAAAAVGLAAIPATSVQAAGKERIRSGTTRPNARFAELAGKLRRARSLHSALKHAARLTMVPEHDVAEPKSYSRSTGKPTAFKWVPEQPNGRLSLVTVSHVTGIALPRVLREFAIRFIETQAKQVVHEVDGRRYIIRPDVHTSVSRTAGPDTLWFSGLLIEPASASGHFGSLAEYQGWEPTVPKPEAKPVRRRVRFGRPTTPRGSD